MLSRRDLGKKVAAGAAVVLATGAAGAAHGSLRRESAPVETDPTFDPAKSDDIASQHGTAPPAAPEEAKAPAPWDLLRPLTVGSAVAHGWTVAALSGEEFGSCVLTLENRQGRQHRVHICRNDGNPLGLVYTKHFDFVVMNGGVGDLPTEEGLARAVAEVAHRVAANERRHEQVASVLMPHAERLRLAESAADCRLR